MAKRKAGNHKTRTAERTTPHPAWCAGKGCATDHGQALHHILPVAIVGGVQDDSKVTDLRVEVEQYDDLAGNNVGRATVYLSTAGALMLTAAKARALARALNDGADVLDLHFSYADGYVDGVQAVNKLLGSFSSK